MAKVNLTDRKIAGLKPEAGRHFDVMDSNLRGFGVRVSPEGSKTFMIFVRMPGHTSASRVKIDHYSPDGNSLAAAREKARGWLELIKQGKDPREVEERKLAAAQRRRANTFRSVAEDFIKERLPSERKGDEVARDIRNNFLERWGGTPIAEITKEDVAIAIKEKRETPAQARNLLGTAKRLFQWAVDQHAYGLEQSPAAFLKPVALIGEKISRSRSFSDDEVRAFVRAARRLQYPYGPVYELLLLTGLRLNEVADATWSEIDLGKKLWVIPAGRMKGKESRARAHAVPLTDEMLAILEALPRFKSGEHLFSTTHGRVPVWMSNKIKAKLDARIVLTLRAIARTRREDPARVTLAPWVNHDLRRVVRSGLSRLRIASEVAEAVLAHVRPGIQGVYDQHEYLDEKREALELWAGRLRDIVTPPPANVVKLKASA
jgi:integrase